MDKFVALVNATAKIDLPLGDFEPICTLNQRVSFLPKPRFAAIDYHNHVDSMSPESVLRIMDEVGIEHLVNITMHTGETAHLILKRFRSATDRISTIGWMDWSDVHHADFVQRTIDRIHHLVDLGAVGMKFWKDFGLTLRDPSGNLYRIDDERFGAIFEACGALKLPVMFHTADPTAFFVKIDRFNERYEELAAHPDWGFSQSSIGKRDLLEARNRVIARHPEVQFVGAHCAESSEDIPFLIEQMEALPNLMIDISARTAELGRQPYTAREFLIRYADRILFGTDLLPDVEMYRLHYRFLETSDEYFEYPSHASRQGRWNIYGLHLPDDVLYKLYRGNALALLTGLGRRFPSG